MVTVPRLLNVQERLCFLTSAIWYPFFFFFFFSKRNLVSFKRIREYTRRFASGTPIKLSGAWWPGRVIELSMCFFKDALGFGGLGCVMVIHSEAMGHRPIDLMHSLHYATGWLYNFHSSSSAFLFWYHFSLLSFMDSLPFVGSPLLVGLYKAC